MATPSPREVEALYVTIYANFKPFMDAAKAVDAECDRLLAKMTKLSTEAAKATTEAAKATAESADKLAKLLDKVAKNASVPAEAFQKAAENIKSLFDVLNKSVGNTSGLDKFADAATKITGAVDKISKSFKELSTGDINVGINKLISQFSKIDLSKLDIGKIVSGAKPFAELLLSRLSETFLGVKLLDTDKAGFAALFENFKKHGLPKSAAELMNALVSAQKETTKAPPILPKDISNALEMTETIEPKKGKKTYEERYERLRNRLFGYIDDLRYKHSRILDKTLEDAKRGQSSPILKFQTFKDGLIGSAKFPGTSSEIDRLLKERQLLRRFFGKNINEINEEDTEALANKLAREHLKGTKNVLTKIPSLRDFIGRIPSKEQTPQEFEKELLEFYKRIGFIPERRTPFGGDTRFQDLNKIFPQRVDPLAKAIIPARQAWLEADQKKIWNDIDKQWASMKNRATLAKNIAGSERDLFRKLAHERESHASVSVMDALKKSIPAAIGKVDAFSFAARRTLGDVSRLSSMIGNWTGINNRASESLGTLINRLVYFRITSAMALYMSIQLFSEFDDTLTRLMARMGDFDQRSRDLFQRNVFLQSGNSLSSSSDMFRALGDLNTLYQPADALRALAVAENHAVVSGQNLVEVSHDLMRIQMGLGQAMGSTEQNLQRMTHLSNVFLRVHQLIPVSIQEISSSFTGPFLSSLRMMSGEQQISNEVLAQGIGLLTAYYMAGVRGAEAGTRASQVMQSIFSSSVANIARWEAMGIRLFDGNTPGARTPRSIFQIIDQLNSQIGAQPNPQARIAALRLLGFDGNESRTLAPLMGMTRMMRKMFLEVMRTDGGLAQAMADMIRGDFKSQMVILKNNFFNLLVTIGEALAPVLAMINDRIKSLIQSFTQLHPLVRQAVVLFTLMAIVLIPLTKFTSGMVLGPLFKLLGVLLQLGMGFTMLFMSMIPLFTILGQFLIATGGTGVLVVIAAFIGIVTTAIGALVVGAATAMPFVLLFVGSLAGIAKWLSRFTWDELADGAVRFFTVVAGFFYNFQENASITFQWFSDNWRSMVDDAGKALAVFVANTLVNILTLLTGVGAVITDVLLPNLGPFLQDFIALMGAALWVGAVFMAQLGSMMIDILDITFFEWWRQNWRTMLSDTFLLVKHFSVYFAQVLTAAFKKAITAGLDGFLKLASIIGQAFAEVMTIFNPLSTPAARTAAEGRLAALAFGAPAQVGNAMAQGWNAVPWPQYENPALATPSLFGFIQGQQALINYRTNKHIARMQRAISEAWAGGPTLATDLGSMFGRTLEIMSNTWGGLRSPLEGFSPTTPGPNLNLNLPGGTLGGLLRNLFRMESMDDAGTHETMFGTGGPGFRFMTTSAERYVVGGPGTAMLETQAFQRSLLHHVGSMNSIMQGWNAGNTPPMQQQPTTVGGP